MMKNAKSLPSETIFSGGAMAEWLGRALQKLARRFDSGSCLQFLNQVISYKRPDRTRFLKSSTKLKCGAGRFRLVPPVFKSGDFF